MGNQICEWHQRAAHPQQTMTGRGVGDVVHLRLGKVQQLRQLLTICCSLIEQQQKLGVGKHQTSGFGSQTLVG